MTQKLTQTEFINRCNEVHNFKYDYSKLIYTSGSHKVTIVCPSHGEFQQLSRNHMKGSGCPLCANLSRNDGVRLTTSSFLDKLNERNETHSPVFLLDEYTNMKTRIKVKCTNGHIWTSKPQDILNGHGCKICAVERREKTMLDKYRKRYYTHSQINEQVLFNLTNKDWLEYEHHAQQKTLQQIALECGVTPKCIKNYINNHEIKHKKFGGSQSEREIVEFLTTSISSDIIINDKNIIYPKELDIVIPTHNLAIEFNGIYWHSELRGKDPNYHLNKTLACNEKNIRLVHIFEHEWFHKRDIVKSRLNSIIGINSRIFARKCSIVELNSKEGTMFLNASHIQGTAAASIYYGLKYDNELVAVMSFGKSRFNKKVEYELIRYSNKLNTNVVGGASRLFKHFIKQHNPKSIISYSDTRWNTGNLYKQLNFKHSHNTRPNYFYFHKSDHLTLYSRQLFQKYKLSKILTQFNPELTEWENMVNNGYNRIWDCGNSVWIYIA